MRAPASASEPVAWLCPTQDNDYFRTKLGWVREMYAYSLATVVAGVPHRVEKRLDSCLIAQPPADDKLVRSPFKFTDPIA
jgi:hypothetical protein